MKAGSVLILFLVVCMAMGCSRDESDRSVGTEIIDIPLKPDGKQSKKKAEITFNTKEIDLGRIAQGDVMTLRYTFRNSGNAPLVISSVEGSCGCTVPRTYPTGKLMPGEGGEIEVEFDSDNKWGQQMITVSVVTNTVPSLTQLIIKADIAAPDQTNTQ